MHLVKSPYDNFSPDEVFFNGSLVQFIGCQIDHNDHLLVSFPWNSSASEFWEFKNSKKVLVKVGSSSIVNVDLGMTIWVSCLSSSSR